MIFILFLQNKSVYLLLGRASSIRSQRSQRYHHTRSSSLGSAPSYFSRTSSVNDVVTPITVHQSSLAEAALHAPRISRNSSRRSYGEEWTRRHWNKVKEMGEYWIWPLLHRFFFFLFFIKKCLDYRDPSFMCKNIIIDVIKIVTYHKTNIQEWQSHRNRIAPVFPKIIAFAYRIDTHKKIASAIASQNWIKIICYFCDYFEFLIDCLRNFTWLRVVTISS